MWEEVKKNYKKIIAIVLIAAIGVGAAIGIDQYLNQKELEEQVAMIEGKMYNALGGLEEDLSEMDIVAIRASQEEILQIQKEVKEIAEEYKEGSTERAMFEELDISLDYFVEMLTVMIEVIDNPWDLITGLPEQKLAVMQKEIENHMALYRQYKSQLGMEVEETNDLNTADL